MKLLSSKLLTISFASMALFSVGCGDDDDGGNKDASRPDTRIMDGPMADGGLKADGPTQPDVPKDTSPDRAAMDVPPMLDAPMAPDAPQGTDAGMAGDGMMMGDGGTTLENISALFAARCVGCHNGTAATASRLNLAEMDSTGSSLRTRLLDPLPLEAYCGMADGGVGSDAGPRKAIVPGDPSQSFLYLKVMNTQPSPGAAPALCGTSMPRVRIPAPDGGTATAIGCELAPGGASANCLSPAETEMIRSWIAAGAP
jgi:hypothetical protein